MDIRYAANPRDVKRYTTEELRNEFLIENLYQPDSVTAVYSHVDRMVTLGCMPVTETVSRPLLKPKPLSEPRLKPPPAPLSYLQYRRRRNNCS